MKTYIGIDLGGTNVRVSLVQPDGTVVQTVKGPSHAHEGAEAVMNNIAAMIRQISGYEKVSGIGIAVPGPVMPDGSGMAMATNIPCLEKYPLRDTLQKEFNIPVILGNDADAAGLAEALAGAGKGKRTVVYVTMSTGIGGAIIFDGKLLPGAHGYSMEVGSMSVDGGRERVHLPGYGAIEDWASGTAVTRMGKDAMPDKDVKHAGIVFDLAQEGYEPAVKICDQVSTDLAVMFANLATTIDPDCFVLGGGMMKSADVFLPLVEEKFKDRVLPALKDIPFFNASLEEPGAVGAAMLPISHGL